MYLREGKRFNIYAPQTIDNVSYGNFVDPILRNQLGIYEIPEPEAPADYDPDLYYKTEQDEQPFVVYTKKSEEQIAQVLLQRAKTQRLAEVNQIVVETSSGKLFDGNETAQERMARAIVALDDTDSIPWVLHDNSIATVNKTELKEALRLAGQKQTELWIKPYSA